jgi:hypothetical protein
MTPSIVRALIHPPPRGAVASKLRRAPAAAAIRIELGACAGGCLKLSFQAENALYAVDIKITAPCIIRGSF